MCINTPLLDKKENRFDLTGVASSTKTFGQNF